MDTLKKLSLEYDGIYGTIQDYTSDANIMNYLTKLKESIDSGDYDAIMYSLSGIDEWYDENIVTFHRTSMLLILNLIKKI